MKWVSPPIVLSALFVLTGMSLHCAANAAGGHVTSVTTAVTWGPVTFNPGSQACEFLDNGIIHAIINLSTSQVVSLKYLKPGSTGNPLTNGTEMISQSYSADSLANHETIYYSASAALPFGNCTVTYPVQNSAQIDMACLHTYNPSADLPPLAPWDTVVHWVLLQGDTGLYTYLETNHPAAYGDTVFGQTGIGWPMNHDTNNFVLENMYIDHLGDGLLDNRGQPDTRRDGLSISYMDTACYDHPSGTLDLNANEEYEITSTNSVGANNSGSKFLNFFECKYSYNCDYWNLGCWGRASDVNQLGAWFVVGSPESFNDGPTVEDYVQGWGLLDINLASAHSGNGYAFSVPSGTAYRKVWGPFFLYMNSMATGSASWTDAQAQAAAEKAACPYSWLTTAPGYQVAANRATVTGTIAITDALNSSVSPVGAWVGLASPDDGAITQNNGVGELINQAEAGPTYGHNWQYQGDKYQYWVRTGAGGAFSIPGVATVDVNGHTARYSITVFSNGANGTNGEMGEYQSGSYLFTAGANNVGTVTWNVPHKGSAILFTVGNPDRSCSEFKQANNAFQPMLNFDPVTFCERWFDSGYYGNAPQPPASYFEFTNPIEYNTASDSPTKLNYSQIAYGATSTTWKEWKWDFNCNFPAAPVTGTYWLNIAYAGTGAYYSAGAGSTNTGLQGVYVDGTPLTFISNDGYVEPGYYPPNESGDPLLREEFHGKYSVSHVPIPSSLFKTGQLNHTITLSNVALQNVNPKSPPSIMYDAISLETPPLLNDGTYVISTQDSGSNVYALGLGASGNTATDVYTYTGSVLSQWTLQNLGYGSGRQLIRLINPHTGECLTGTSGNIVTQAPPDGTSSQIWQLYPNGTNYLLRNTGQGFQAANGQTITSPYTSGSNAVILSGANGGTAGENWTLVLAAPNFTSPTTLNATVNTASSYVIQAGNYPTTYGVTGLPPGYTTTASTPTTGLITGTPTTAGTYPMVVTATNSGGTSTQTVTVTVQ